MEHRPMTSTMARRPTGLSAFAKPGAFHRGNIHTHSTASDGMLSPKDVCRHYAEAGYGFLCLSDHFLERFSFPITDTECFRTERFTTILGAELHAPANSHGELWHILACGLPRGFMPTGPDEDAVSLVGRAADAGAFIGIAHPQWSSLTVEDGRQMAAVAHSVEIYNTGCAIECSRGDGTALLDQLLNEGFALTGYAADDAHFRLADDKGGWMMVKALRNEPETLLAAMKAGDFYSSQGPTIETITVAEGFVTVECSPVVNIAAVGRGSRAENVNARQIGRATLPLKRFEDDWFRIVVTDAAGHRAWSNPIWI